MMCRMNDVKKLLLFGATGRTGMVLAQEALRQGHELITPSHAELDLADSEAVSAFVRAQLCDAVINCAAISDVERCGQDPVLAHKVNAMAPAAMALACRHTGARFIHLSTDYVLDGRKAGFKDESTKCRPINLYAGSKEEGEAQVMEAWDESIICRVSWVCGNPAKPSFIEANCARALAGEPLAAVGDKYSMPTHARDIARVCLSLTSHAQARGIVHLCSRSDTPLSWWDCASLTMEELHEQGALSELPHITSQLLEDFLVGRDERPRHTAMRCTKLAAWGLETMTAREAIGEAVKSYLAQH